MTKTKFFTLILSLALLTQVFASCQTAQNETFSPSEAASQNASVTLPSEEASQGGTEVLPSENPSESTTDTQPSETPTEEKPTLPEVAVLDEYELLLYAQSVGESSGNTGVPVYSDNLFEFTTIHNSSLPKKRTEVITGQKVDVYYDFSYKYNFAPFGCDAYFSVEQDDGKYISIYYDSVTGNIRLYRNESFVRNPKYESDVTPKSSEEEYIAYAKKLLREMSGVSVEGLDMKIRTIIYHEDGSTETVQKFVNNSDVDPNFNARYRFNFSATIDGIPRYDDVTVTMTNVGEIIFLDARLNDNFELFKNVKIDRELLKKVGFTVDSSNNTKYLCYASDTELWLQIVPTPPKGEMGRIYLVKLAEIVKNEKEPDEEIKEPSKDNSSPTEEATGEYRVPTVEKIPEKISD